MIEENGAPAGRSGEDGEGFRSAGPVENVPPSQPVPPRGFAPGPAFEPHQAWAPPAAPVLSSFAFSAPSPRRRGPRTGAVVSIAAVTAVLVGGGAGYGGAKLAQSEAVATSTPSPAAAIASPEPSVPVIRAAPLPPAPATANTVEIAKRVLPGTVMIQVGNGTGSGFVLDTQGRIMTNNHVVAGAAGGDKIRVVFADGRRQSATLLGRSPSYDIAVISVKASASLAPIAIGNSDQTQVGQPVVAVGSPLGLPGTVTQGIVSARNRAVVVNGNAAADARTAYINALQTDAPINPGNSGGPLVNLNGAVLGINSSIASTGSSSSSSAQSGNIGIGFAIPADVAVRVSSELISSGKSVNAALGVTVGGSDSNLSTAIGVPLQSVTGGAAAAKAGLQQGDVVTKVDDFATTTPDGLIAATRFYAPGTQVTLTYSRGGGAPQTAKVTLGSQ